jgi:hypothetical protein
MTGIPVNCEICDEFEVGDLVVPRYNSHTSTGIIIELLQRQLPTREAVPGQDRWITMILVCWYDVPYYVPEPQIVEEFISSVYRIKKS